MSEKLLIISMLKYVSIIMFHKFVLIYLIGNLHVYVYVFTLVPKKY